MNYILVTRNDGEELLINVDHIQSARKQHDDGNECHIDLLSGDDSPRMIHLSESFDSLLEKLDNA